MRLASAGIFGLLLASGYVTAPVLFAQAPSRQLAGMLAGSVFHVVNLAGFVLLAAVATLGWRGMGWWLQVALLGLALLLALNEFGVAPVIARLKAAGDVDRHAFVLWHGLAAVMHLVATLLAAMLVTCHGGEGRLRARHH